MLERFLRTQTLARELADVVEVFVESGSLDTDSALQSLLVDETVGIPYFLTSTRIRQFGRSSAL